MDISTFIFLLTQTFIFPFAAACVSVPCHNVDSGRLRAKFYFSHFHLKLDYHGGTPTPRHQFPVSQFGMFSLETSIPVTIRSLDGSPECPEIGVVQMAETAVIDVVATDGSAASEGAFDLVESANEGHDLAIRAVGEQGHELHVWLPFSMGVNVKATDAGMCQYFL